MLGHLDQVQEQLDATRGEEHGAKKLLAVSERVLTKVIEEKKKLQDSNVNLGKELKDVRAQLADSVKENKKLRGGIFSMWPLLSYNSLEVAVADIAVIAGVLMNRPEEEVFGSSNDLLRELSQLHKQARQAMRSVAKGLWPSDSPPGSMEKLVELFKGARQRFRLWKISACRQGAREAWAMVKMWYTKADPNHMAEVRPVGPDRK